MDYRVVLVWLCLLGALLYAVTHIRSAPARAAPFCRPHEGEPLPLISDEDEPIGHVHWMRVQGPRGTFEMACNDPRTDRYISGTLSRGAVWEPEIMEALKAHLGEGKVFVDVGANIGYFSAAAVTLGAAVYSVEAVWPNYVRLLMTRTRLGSPQQWRVRHGAAAEESGRAVHLAVASAASNSGNFKVAEGAAQWHAVTLRLDEWIAAPVDLMKLDVEGHEAQALAGATRLICVHGVRVIVMEYTSDVRTNKQCPHEELFAWLTRIGYRMYSIDGRSPLEWERAHLTYRRSNVMWKAERKIECD